MKKLILLLLIIFPLQNVVAWQDLTISSKEEVTLVSCDSATTSWIKLNDEKIRIRLIAFDTSVSNTTNVDEYVCYLLKNAKKIEIEKDLEDIDEYNRLPVWVYIDDVLLQAKLIEEGYGQVNYIKDNYNYLDDLCEKEKNAVSIELGIWATGVEEKYCDSGVEITEIKKNDVINKDGPYATSKNILSYMIVFNGLILMMLLIMKRYNR